MRGGLTPTALVLLAHALPASSWSMGVAFRTTHHHPPATSISISASASATPSDASDDALQAAQRELREARAEAAAARNAEARLRAMVRAADQNAERQSRNAADAEESRDQLLDELKALQTLTALDTRAYEETIDEMKGAIAELKGQIQNLDPNEGVGADESAASDAAAAEQKLSYRQLEEALAESKLEAWRNRLGSEDLRAELVAFKKLAQQDEDMMVAQHRAELQAERQRWQQLDASARTGRSTGQGAEAVRVQQLELQVSQLLAELGQQQTVADELMILRQKYAESESLVKQLQQQAEQYQRDI